MRATGRSRTARSRPSAGASGRPAGPGSPGMRSHVSGWFSCAEFSWLSETCCGPSSEPCEKSSGSPAWADRCVLLVPRNGCSSASTCGPTRPSSTSRPADCSIATTSARKAGPGMSVVGSKPRGQRDAVADRVRLGGQLDRLPVREPGWWRGAVRHRRRPPAVPGDRAARGGGSVESREPTGSALARVSGARRRCNRRRASPPLRPAATSLHRGIPGAPAVAEDRPVPPETKPAPPPLREYSVNRIKHWTVRIAPLVALVVASGAAGKWR